MIKSKFVKEYLVSYARYNHGKTNKQAKWRRKVGNHIIRGKLKRELLKELKMQELCESDTR